MKPVIILVLGAAIISTPALASRHPIQAANEIMDVAAFAPYPIETVAPLRRGWYHRHSSVSALRRSRSWRHSSARHFVKRPRPAEEAHSRPVERGSASTLKITAAPPQDALALAAGALVGLAEGFEDGMATAMPIIVRQRPYHFEGKLTIGDASFDFGTGGYGRGSVPYGDWEIDDSEGDWGKRHHALGLNGDELYDRQLGVDREGIEMHGAYHLASAGCVAVEHWDKARAKIVTMIGEFGHAWLHVWPGVATVTPEKSMGRVIVVLTEREHFAESTSRHYVKRRYARHWTHRHYASK